jgi:hypothetical protein
VLSTRITREPTYVMIIVWKRFRSRQTNDDDSAMKPFADSMMSAVSCGKDRDKLSAIGAATHDQTGLIARAMTS